jgi:hypothetical protein
MVNPAGDAGAKKKNRKIPANELLNAEIIQQHQVLTRRALPRIPRPGSWWTGGNREHAR